MSYFADLSPCTEFPIAPSAKLLAVGWLDKEQPYAKGFVPQTVVARLVELLVNPWQPVGSMGGHDCPLCRFTSGPRQFNLATDTLDTGYTIVQMGINNLFVPAQDCIFVAPSLILHYMDAHEYAPPQSFQQAVIACPDMRSMAYLKAIRQHLPQELLALAKGQVIKDF